jgi:hypothetical protein
VTAKPAATRRQGRWGRSPLIFENLLCFTKDVHARRREACVRAI